MNFACSPNGAQNTKNLSEASLLNVFLAGILSYKTIDDKLILYILNNYPFCKCLVVKFVNDKFKLSNHLKSQ